MPNRISHPSPDELSAFSLGQLAPSAGECRWESHISECQPCCETLLGLSKEDTFVELLQEAGQLPHDRTVDQTLGSKSSMSSAAAVPAVLAEHKRYEVIRLIGKGGMGDVYEARHRKMDRKVAIKVINRDLVRKPEAVDRFHREVRTAAQLSHPNIVTAYDADQTADFHFMVMEHVDGVDLSEKVKGQGALPIDEACDYVRQAAIGLQHAHELGMVHRDIKPPQSDGHRRRHGEDPGLWPGFPGSYCTGRRSDHGISLRSDGGRSDHGNPRFHLARTGQRTPARLISEVTSTA